MSVTIVNLTLDEVEVLGITEFSSISMDTGKIEQFKKEKGNYYLWYSNANSWRNCTYESFIGLIDPNSLFTVHYEKD